MKIEVGVTVLEFVEHPLYTDAHPGEECDPEERCTFCAIAVRPDTGERVLLWHVTNDYWSVSRADPSFGRHYDELFHLSTPRNVDSACLPSRIAGIVSTSDLGRPNRSKVTCAD